MKVMAKQGLPGNVIWKMLITQNFSYEYFLKKSNKDLVILKFSKWKEIYIL